jgi:DNA-binding transcriptional LysR family regulator
MDRLEALKVFIAVADKASFAEAARSLRISPTAATRAIAALEDSLGVALLRRTTRSVGLTVEGAAYLERCRHALDELDEAARSLRGESAEPRGLLVVTAPVMFGRMHIRPIVSQLLRAHPKLDVRLTLTDRVVRLIDEGIDVAVRIAELSDSALHALQVGEVRRVLVASPDYLTARGMPATVAALHDHDLIAFDNFSRNSEWRFAGPAHAAIRLEPRLLTNSIDAAIDAAIDGLGIARTLSYQVMRHVADGRLVLVLDDLAPPPSPVSILYPANRQRSANVRAFVAAAKRTFGGQPIV